MKWVTRPERPKGAKDEVKQARRAKSRPEGPPTRGRARRAPRPLVIGIKCFEIQNALQPGSGFYIKSHLWRLLLLTEYEAIAWFWKKSPSHPESNLQCTQTCILLCFPHQLLDSLARRLTFVGFFQCKRITVELFCSSSLSSSSYNVNNSKLQEHQ